MAVSAVQTNEYKSQPASYIKAAAFGAVSGYALKYALPITQKEADEQFSSYLDNIKTNSAKAKEATITSIRGRQPQTDGLKHTLDIIDTELLDGSIYKTTSEKLRSGIFNEPTRKEIKSLIKEINESGRKAKVFGAELVSIMAKHLRSKGAFMGIGAGVALSVALVHNVVTKMSEE